MKVKLLVILSLLGVGFLILYVGQRDKVRMHDDVKSTKEEDLNSNLLMYDDVKSVKAVVLKKVPIGSSIQDAKRIMEENGFGCQMYYNEGFIEKQGNDPLGQSSIEHKNKDFLLCSKDSTPIQAVIREWSVFIVHKNDVVSDIFVKTWVTGP